MTGRSQWRRKATKRPNASSSTRSTASLGRRKLNDGSALPSQPSRSSQYSAVSLPTDQPSSRTSLKAKGYRSGLISGQLDQMYSDGRDRRTSAEPVPSPHTASFRSFTAVNSTVASDSEAQEPEGYMSEKYEDDSLNEVVMALDVRDRGSLGCALYVASEEKLCLMEEMKISDTDTVDMLLLHVQSTHILLNNRVPQEVEDKIRRGARSLSIDEGRGCVFSDCETVLTSSEGEFGAYGLDCRPSSEFGYDAAVDKLLNLDIGSGSTTTLFTPDDDTTDMALIQGRSEQQNGQKSRLMRLGASINLGNPLTIGCAGAIMSFLQRRRSSEYLPGDEAAQMAFRIRKIEVLTLADTMFVNIDTLSSLAILRSESHPNFQMQGPDKSSSGSKESLSLYGIFHHFTQTPQGKQKLRQMFLRPSMNIKVIQERQATIKMLLSPENEEALGIISRSLKKIKNQQTILINLRRGACVTTGNGKALQRGIWADIEQFTSQTARILEAAVQLSGTLEVPLIQRVIEHLGPVQLRQIGQLIVETVDFEQSIEHHRTCIIPGVDAELDRLKRLYNGLDDLLTTLLQKVAHDLPEWSRSYVSNCAFFPQLGFLIVVSLDPETGKSLYEGEGMDDDNWEFMFKSEQKCYYKNQRMRQMDAHIGDIHGIICDKEIELTHRLATRILQHEEIITAASDICGELDCLIALAQGARRHRYVSPQMTTDNIIHIRAGRHPLQELAVPSYIPNDTYMAGGCGEEEAAHSRNEGIDEPSMLIMTGPNYSGKSVYMKQIALIVYMAHIGSYVPAESAIIGLTDKILTRIATRETVSRSQSAFVIDLQQIALAINLATRRSLVIIDEFGKGTSSSDGAGLACGVLENLLHRGTKRPKVLAATHFHEIFENEFLQPQPHVSFGHMQVQLDMAQQVEDQITYLYRFIEGRSTESFGTYCAAANGIDPSIVDRAKELIVLSARGEDLVVACAKLSKQEEEALHEADRLARHFLMLDFSQGRGIGDMEMKFQELFDVAQD